jgi:hypothetical protein
MMFEDSVLFFSDYLLNQSRPIYVTMGASEQERMRLILKL